MLKKCCFLFVFGLFLLGCAHKPPKEQDLHTLGNIINLHTHQTVSLTHLIDQLAQARYVLIGEEHDQPVHHQIENDLLDQLEKRACLGGVVLEMLAVDQQAAVTQAQANAKSLRADELKTRIAWREWDWSLYRDLIVRRLRSSTPLIAANLTDSEVRTLMTGAAPLRGFRSTAPQVKQTLAELITSYHAVDPLLLSKMVEVQQFRDRRMAEKLQKPTASAVLIAGNNHVRKDIGVPLHLIDFNPENQAKTQTLLLSSEAPKDINQHQADYLWITH